MKKKKKKNKKSTQLSNTRSENIHIPNTFVIEISLMTLNWRFLGRGGATSRNLKPISHEKFKPGFENATGSPVLMVRAISDVFCCCVVVIGGAVEGGPAGTVEVVGTGVVWAGVVVVVAVSVGVLAVGAGEVLVVTGTVVGGSVVVDCTETHVAPEQSKISITPEYAPGIVPPPKSAKFPIPAAARP